MSGWKASATGLTDRKYKDPTDHERWAGMFHWFKDDFLKDLGSVEYVFQIHLQMIKVYIMISQKKHVSWFDFPSDNPFFNAWILLQGSGKFGPLINHQKQTF